MVHVDGSRGVVSLSGESNLPLVACGEYDSGLPIHVAGIVGGDTGCLNLRAGSHWR